jgi:feruloyl esterase
VESLAENFSDDDLHLVQQAVLAACDADDGLEDGLVGAFRECSDRKVLAQLHKRRCPGSKQSACLTAAQIKALERAQAGPHNRQGKPLYTSFPWDSGMADPGWRLWRLGIREEGTKPAMAPVNITLAAPALATIYITPPSVLQNSPQAGLNYMLGFDFDADAARIYASTDRFPKSSWDDTNARSSDLSGFRARGGRLIVWQGVSDPIFSINDTIDWWSEIDQRNRGSSAQFVRVFPVPGMGHCGGGPTTEHFDAFSALVQWVEKGVAPDRIDATAGPGTAWPGRTRPLCPYPRVARFTGTGDPERAENFTCALPKRQAALDAAGQP